MMTHGHAQKILWAIAFQVILLALLLWISYYIAMLIIHEAHNSGHTQLIIAKFMIGGLSFIIFFTLWVVLISSFVRLCRQLISYNRIIVVYNCPEDKRNTVNSIPGETE